MREPDVALLARWVKTPAVAEWWREEAAMSRDELAQKMSPRILGEEKVSPFLFSLAGFEAGYIQSYRSDDWPEAREMHGLPGAVGVDLLIGEVRWLHKGYGARVLRAFADRHVFTGPEVQSCVIDPEEANVIAVRSYEKAGFRHVKDVISPEDGRIYTIMKLDRL